MLGYFLPPDASILIIFVYLGNNNVTGKLCDTAINYLGPYTQQVIELFIYLFNL